MKAKIFSVLLCFIYFYPGHSYGQDTPKRGHTCTEDLNLEEEVPPFFDKVDKKIYLAAVIGKEMPIASQLSESWHWGKALAGISFNWLVLGASVSHDVYPVNNSYFSLGLDQMVYSTNFNTSTSFGLFSAVDKKDLPVSFGYEWHKIRKTDCNFVFIGIGKEKYRFLIFSNLVSYDKISVGIGVSTKFD